MEPKMIDLYNMLGKIDRRHIQLALLILTLTLFVLGAGAPGALGDH
jgi:hypothetical protein